METTVQLYNRVHFFDVFSLLPNGSVAPKSKIKIGGVTFDPGVSITPGVLFSGVNIFQYMDKDMAIQTENGIPVIKGFYLR